MTETPEARDEDGRGGIDLDVIHAVAKLSWDRGEREYWTHESDMRPFDPSITELDGDDCDRGREWVEIVTEVLTDLRAVLGPVSGAVEGAGEECPTCSGPIRETVGLICQTCGTDYGTGQQAASVPLFGSIPPGAADPDALYWDLSTAVADCSLGPCRIVTRADGRSPWIDVPARQYTADGQANDCTHQSSSGVDAAEIGPGKVWRCDHCGLTWVDGGRHELAADPVVLQQATKAVEAWANGPQGDNLTYVQRESLLRVARQMEAR